MTKSVSSGGNRGPSDKLEYVIDIPKHSGESRGYPATNHIPLTSNFEHTCTGGVWSTHSGGGSISRRNDLVMLYFDLLS